MRLFPSLLIVCLILFFSCTATEARLGKTAKEILGNPEFTAISFGGFRKKSREFCPTVEALKEDMRILSAMNIKLIRTYHTSSFPHAERTLQAIRELKNENNAFEMYVMLGAWIECEGAFTESRNHEKENLEKNRAEINTAIELAKEFPEIVKIIAVGNESMVHWAESYYVTPRTVLAYVKQLQQLKGQGDLDQNLWITSSDNFASWGGGSAEYHQEDLKELIRTVDYVSMHTYPFHDTHYNPEFWQIDSTESSENKLELMTEAIERAKAYAISQYTSTKKYVRAIAPNKAVHIGETGWATSAYKFYGKNGSNAAGEFQQKLYYDRMRAWTNENNISCFFFEAYNEQWKDLTDESASENHFGLINLKGEAKYVLWDLVDSAIFEGLERGGYSITKTYNGDEATVLSKVMAPPFKTINN